VTVFQSLLSLRPSLSFEIGCGSGVVTAFLHRLYTTITNADSSSSSDGSLSSIAVDINQQALQCSQRTMRLNGIEGRVELVQCDLCGPLAEKLKGRVDVLLMNPPYVPTERVSEEVKVSRHGFEVYSFP